MGRFFMITGAILAAVAVVLGAFGAHALKARLDAGMLQVFETGVKYQMYHALALIITGMLAEKIGAGSLTYAGYFFIAGIVFFSGSLYLLSTKSILGAGSLKFLGPVTPLGGLCFIIGWGLLVFALIKNKPL